MKQKLMVSALVVIGMMIAGIAFAADELTDTSQTTLTASENGHQGFRPMPPDGFEGDEGLRPKGPRPPKHAGCLLGRYIHDNMAMEVLSQLTGQAPETLAAELEEGHIRGVLDAYEIDPETFRNAMDEKTAAVAQKASECGLITPDQLADLIQKMAEEPVPPNPETEE
jgi:hypothetical protein